VPISTDQAHNISKPIRRPEDIPQQSITTMVEQWSTLQLRRNLLSHDPDPDDLFADLAYRTRVAQEITYGRWCVVADILRTGAPTSWAEIGAALNMTETEARTGFRAWMTGQLDLHRRTGTIGLTEAESKHLRAQSEAVTRVTP
jgi:hypothetical protein